MKCTVCSYDGCTLIKGSDLVMDRYFCCKCFNTFYDLKKQKELIEFI